MISPDTPLLSYKDVTAHTERQIDLLVRMSAEAQSPDMAHTHIMQCTALLGFWGELVMQVPCQSYPADHARMAAKVSAAGKDVFSRLDAQH